MRAFRKKNLIKLIFLSGYGLRKLIDTAGCTVFSLSNVFFQILNFISANAVKLVV